METRIATYASGRPEAVVPVEVEVYRVPEVDPFLVREKLAEATEAVRHGFVRAHCLRRVRVGNVEFEAINHLVQASRG